MDTQPTSPTTPTTNGLAISSLVVGILGLSTLLGIGPILALILGYAARRQIRRSRQTEGGAGLAKAGVVLGWIGIGVSLIWAVLAMLGALGVLGSVCGLGLCTFCSLLFSPAYPGYYYY